MKKLYNKEYYENGKDLGISGYTNYRWLPHLTKPMCKDLIEYIKIKKDDKILDFGCAKGFLVKAFCELGYHHSVGVDISEYAINNADPIISDKVFLYKGKESIELAKLKVFTNKFDITISKDVFEHIPYDEIDNILKIISKNSKRIFAAIPLAKNGRYIIEDYENDVTHIIREDMEWWKNKFLLNGFCNVKCSYLVKGIKENWKQYTTGNGFFLASTTKN